MATTLSIMKNLQPTDISVVEFKAYKNWIMESGSSSHTVISSHFKENLKLVVSKEEVDFVAKIYSDVFNRQYWRPDCITCSARPLIKMIERMDKVYELYKK